MPTTRILTVVGARPQFVKAAVISRAVQKWNAVHEDTIDESILHTGQHYDERMSEVFFEEMEIPRPNVQLGVGSGPHGAMTGDMLAGIERELFKRKPDYVLLYGDTNSTVAGALAASKLSIPVAHVEAGLRSFNRKMPEEINRVVTDILSELLFCPSDTSKNLLAKEGITEGVHVVGDVMVDAILHYRTKAVAPKIGKPFALATCHRPENTDSLERLSLLMDAFARSPIQIVLPVHPRTANALTQEGLTFPPRVTALGPVSYFEMLGLLNACSFVLTDSGGLQKEAYIYDKRCITLRDQTEWTELVDAGANRLVGADPTLILESMTWAQTPLTEKTSFYGDGRSAEKILEALVSHAIGHG